MAIVPPRWCKNAIATKDGWRHHKTGELLLKRRGLLDELEVSEIKEPEIITETTSVNEEVIIPEVTETKIDEPKKIKKKVVPK